MAIMSVSVPEDLKQRMSEMDEVNWSAVARKAFEQKVEQVEFLKQLAGKSKLTEKSSREISRKISENMTKKFRSM